MWYQKTQRLFKNKVWKESRHSELMKEMMYKLCFGVFLAVEEHKAKKQVQMLNGQFVCGMLIPTLVQRPDCVSYAGHTLDN